MVKRVTLADIAASSGVSIATVSAVLNGRREGIFYCEDTRLRVLANARKLGYRANALARNLRLGRSLSVGVALDDITVPFLAEVIHAAGRELRRSGYALLLMDLDQSDGRRTPLDLFRESRVDGVLLAGATGALADREILALARGGMPVVLVERDSPGDAVATVQVDNREGGRLAAEHLLACGCHRPVAIAGPEGNVIAAERLAGAVERFRQSGVDLDRSSPGGWTLEGGYQAMRVLLPAAVDGVFACNDMMAIGALRALREVRLAVPDAVAVVGFDDMPLAAFASPPLTTVRQPAAELGRLAARRLLHCLDGKRFPEIEESLPLCPELIARGSSYVRR